MDVFEDKESTESGSPVMAGGGGDGSGVKPQVINRAVSMSMEKSLWVVTTGGGGSGGELEGAIVSTSAVNSGGSDLMNSSGKKKRGRPRKYDSDGNLRVPYIAAAATAAGAGAFSSQPQPQPTGFTLTTPPGYSSTPKRGRGRPSGSASGSSGNWKSFSSSLGEILANTAGGDFTPHVVTVYAGEDVAGKILSFAQTGSRGLCVLSANGSISNATIRQPGSSGGILTYEGRFEILSLTGSFTTSENGGIKSRTGGLSVSLAGPDGRVIGGGVAGLLMAANPIQVVLGSFMPNNIKTQKRKYNTESRVSNVGRGAVQGGGGGGEGTPPPSSQQLQGASGQGKADNNDSCNKEKDNQNQTMLWNNNGSTTALNLDQRPSPDINLSVSMEHHHHH